MWEQVRTSAGIHMSTFKDESEAPKDVDPDDPDSPVPEPAWTPTETEWARIRGVL